MVEGLLPSSIQWLINKGYIIRQNEDGATVIAITPAGHKYFAQFNKAATLKEEPDHV